nr:T9SS type A sorting domain-containing protein [uncultured Flavobacterium sp.]
MMKKYFLALFFSFYIFSNVFGQTCAAPTALNVTNVTGTSAVLSWTSPGAATQWEILVLMGTDPEPTGSFTPSIPTSVNPFTITGLTPCTSYKFYVRAVCAPDVYSPHVGPFHFTTGPITPGQSCPFSATISATQDIPTSSLHANVIAGTPPFTFQWSLNGNPIPGATSQNLAINGQGGTYQVIVTDSGSLTTTASITIQGISVVANNDTMTVYSTSNTTVNTPSVLSNDLLNGYPINPNNIGNVVLTPLTVPSGFTINPNGTISVLSGTAGGTYTLTYQICSVQSPTSCSTGTATVTVANEGFLLNAFIDTNTNGIQDSGELSFNFGQFTYQINNTGAATTIASSNGMYYIQESNPANSYDFSFIINSNYSSYYAVSPSAYNDISFIAGSGVMVLNFPVTQVPYTDLSVNIFPSGAPPRPGFTYTNLIRYKNNGNQAITSGTITFSKDNAVTITNISQAGTIPTATGFTYDFANLLPNEARSIYVTMQVPTIPTVTLGNTLTNSVSTTVPVNDINAANNTASLTQVIVGSYDPNDKTESHGDKIVHSSFTSADYLTYTIQFENTGTYQAENVRINDILDIKLDETSLKMVDASHPYTLSQVGTTLNWNMNGIDLLPSGKGHVTFRIKPKPGYAIGDIIPNTASIFFDFNPAIVTNTFTTEFVATMGVPEFTDPSLTVYPNPANDIVTIISNDKQVITTVTINDISGKTVQNQIVTTSTAVIDLSNLASGIYFVKAISEGGEKVIKLIKQ